MSQHEVELLYTRWRDVSVRRDGLCLSRSFVDMHTVAASPSFLVRACVFPFLPSHPLIPSDFGIWPLRRLIHAACVRFDPLLPSSRRERDNVSDTLEIA